MLAGPQGCGFEAVASHYLASMSWGGRLTVLPLHDLPEKLRGPIFWR